MFATVSSERDTWKENQNALVKWLDLVGLAQDFTKLLALLHVRTEYEPHLWAPFDTRSSYAAFSTVKGDMYSYNAKSVIMHGKHYGVLKDFDVHSAHGWAELGFPRAVITFEAQRAISIMLRKAVDLLIIDSKASGNSKWTSRVSKGLRSANEGVFWGAYHNQEFAPPARFDPQILLEKARNHLNFLRDELDLMQCDPEYMRQYIVDVKTSTYVGANQSTDEVWGKVAREITITWTTNISLWQRIVTEAENLQASFAKNGLVVTTGTHLTKDIDTAVRCFGETVRSWLLWTTVSNFPFLRRLEGMQGSFKRFNQMFKGSYGDVHKLPVSDFQFLRRLEGLQGYFKRSDKMLKGSYGDVRKFLDPTIQSDRVLMGVWTILSTVMTNNTSGISSRAHKLKGELGCLTYSRGVANWLSGMALLDELYGSWHWRQLTGYHDPLNKDALELDIRSRDMLPPDFKFDSKANVSSMQNTAGDIQCGQLMRAFCDSPLPKGAKDLSWLEKMTETRKRLREMWHLVRTVYHDRQMAIGRSELFVASILSQMSFDKSSEYFARVQAERQKIEEAVQRSKMLGQVQQNKLSFGEETWDTVANKDNGVRRTLAKKTNAARNHGKIKEDLEQVANKTSANDETLLPTSHSVPQITVKQDTMSIMSKMFPTGVEGTKGVRWTQLVQALTEAGLTVTQGAGSAVNFANEHGAITIHQPHDRDGPNVDAIMLRGLGRRFNKWFGWTSETFVLREKGDKES